MAAASGRKNSGFKIVAAAQTAVSAVPHDKAVALAACRQPGGGAVGESRTSGRRGKTR